MSHLSTVRDRTIHSIAASLEIDESGMNDDSHLEALCLQSLLGTDEEENRPSPTDGIRPSEALFVLICWNLQEEFDVLFSGEELDRIETFRDLYLLIESHLAES